MLLYSCLNQLFLLGVAVHSSRFFTFLLGTAAISLVLASTARAEVLIDQQQLTGQGKTIVQQQFYDDVRARPSPFGNASINPNLPNEPVVIGDASPSSSHLPTAPKPIMLKPLPKWGMAAPSQPISAGGRTAIALKPPGSDKLINQLASQSPVRSPQSIKVASSAPLRLRPPAPIPAMGIAAPQMAQNNLGPKTLQDPSAPQPQARVQMAMNVAPIAAAVPVSQMGELRAEDVVALDMNALQGASPATTAVKAAAPVAPPPAPPVVSPKAEPIMAPRSVPDEEDSDSDVLPEVPKFMPPLDDAPAQTSELKSAPAQTASAEPQFMSPLTEGLPVDEESGTKVAMAAPAAPLREPKRETPQIDTSKHVETIEPELPNKVTAAKNVLPDLPPAPDAPVAPAAVEATSQAEKLLEPATSTTHASADQAADAVVSSLKAPVEKQNAPVPVPMAEIEPDVEIKDGAVHWKKDRIAAETIEKNTRIAEASQRAELMAQAEAEKLAAQKIAAQKIIDAEAKEEAARVAEIKAKEEAEAKRLAEIEAKRVAEEEAKRMAEQKVQEEEARLIAEAKAKAEAEVEAQRLAEVKAKEEAERLARQEAERAIAEKEAAEANAKLAAEEKAKAIADAEAKAKAEAEAERLAKAQAEEALRVKEEEIAQARAELEAQRLAAVQAAEAEAAAKVEADAAMKLAIEEKAKVLEAEVAKNKMAVASVAPVSTPALEKEPEIIKAEAVPTEHISRVNIIEPVKIAPIVEVKQASLSSGAIDGGSATANSEPLTRETLLFSSGLSALPDNADPVIRELAQQMKNNRDAKMVINAYADGASQTGAAARRLSLQRAMLMRDALNKQGVPVNRVQVRAQTSVVGEENPDRVEVVVQ